MALRFNEFISKLSSYGSSPVTEPQEDILYNSLRLLTEKTSEFVPGTIYVGDLSEIQDLSHLRSDIGLVFSNKNRIEFTDLKCNATELPVNTDIPNFINDALEIFRSNQRVIESAAALLNSLVQGKGVDQIIRSGAEILGKSISLVDYTGKLITSSDPISIGSPPLTPEGYLKQENYSVFRSHHLTKKINESAIPLLVDLTEEGFPRMVVGKIVIKNKIVGHLSAIEGTQPFKEDDIEIIKSLIDVVTSEIQKNNYYLLMAGLESEYLILDLLQENDDRPTSIEDRIRAMKWDGYNDFSVVSIHVPRNDDAFFFVEYLRTQLGYIFPFSRSVYHNEHVILILYKDHIVHSVKRKLSPILKENGLTAGISMDFASLIELKRHNEQAEFAAGMGKFLQKADCVFLYEEWYIYYLLSIINRHANLKDFCHPGITKLIKYDKENATDYYQTLYEYLIGSANIVQVAQKLFIHRNTLYHRIKRIAEITGVDLDNGEYYLELLLSYKIMELYKGIPNIPAI